MSETELQEALAQVEFLRGLSKEQVDRLAAIGRVAEYPAQSTIFEEYDDAKEVFLILKGKVALANCTPTAGCRMMMTVNDGELMGWSPLVQSDRFSATAHTLEPTCVVALDGEKLLSICQQDPEFGFEFLRRTTKVLEERLMATRLQMLDLCGSQLPDLVLETD
ncbi:MAG: cyclic nucleotide-binding domain-containing protein [Planctomycetales bacterium]|nr:cyclic nucleotide-binding domain-containing protein [Planctomycetales bacterium]